MELGDAVANMAENAQSASGFLKALSHKTRLMILCHLATGEKSVTELEVLLQTRQATVSQHLARLKQDRLVATRREGKAIYYSVGDGDALQILMVLHARYCGPK